MRVDEIAPAELVGADLSTLGEPRLQGTPAWLDFMARILPVVAGPGARLRVLAAFEAGRPVIAIPLLRTSAVPEPRPFPLDLADIFFGIWIRAVPFAKRPLWIRARLSAGFGTVLDALNPSLRQTLVVHAPLSPVSAAMVAPDLPPNSALPAITLLLAEARAIADREDRCLLIPRVPLREACLWGDALYGWIQVPSYGNSEILPDSPPPTRIRQMIRRNARLMDQHAVTVEETPGMPAGVPFGQLFAGTAARHRDPAPALDDAFFHKLGASFPGAVRFFSASVGGILAGFLAAIRHPTSWEAFKCGTDRALAGQAPVYLDLVYRRLPAAAGATRIELGPGDLDIKRRYGAHTYPVAAYVALPRSFRGRNAFAAYLQEIGEGIDRHQAMDHVAKVATTPK